MMVHINIKKLFLYSRIFCLSIFLLEIFLKKHEKSFEKNILFSYTRHNLVKNFSFAVRKCRPVHSRVSGWTPSQARSVFMKNKLTTQNLKGSVMVVGGGIAGMQSALDLANSGFYVHLLEKTPGIGGVMAQLDKTFPTNDCSM
jgi:NADPH-dependent 2,4-dienoyl-CoA reductase/sulfur reductase-like enzyme